MRICPECCTSPWPFVVVLFLAGVSAFLTWLTISFSQLGMMERVAGSIVVFFVVGGTMLHYILSCMKRYCRHGRHPPHQCKAAHSGNAK